MTQSLPNLLMNPYAKRVLVLIIGWSFILLGIVGLFLPILQGVLFILIGLIILSSEYLGPSPSGQTASALSENKPHRGRSRHKSRRLVAAPFSPTWTRLMLCPVRCNLEVKNPAYARCDYIR